MTELGTFSIKLAPPKRRILRFIVGGCGFDFVRLGWEFRPRVPCSTSRLRLPWNFFWRICWWIWSFWRGHYPVVDFVIEANNRGRRINKWRRGVRLHDYNPSQAEGLPARPILWFRQYLGYPNPLTLPSTHLISLAKSMGKPVSIISLYLGRLIPC